MAAQYKHLLPLLWIWILLCSMWYSSSVAYACSNHAGHRLAYSLPPLNQFSIHNAKIISYSGGALGQIAITPGPSPGNIINSSSPVNRPVGYAILSDPIFVSRADSEASFNTTFTFTAVSTSEPLSSHDSALVFVLLPSSSSDFLHQVTISRFTNMAVSPSLSSSGIPVVAKIDLGKPSYDSDMGIYFTVAPRRSSSVLNYTYTVWIDYCDVVHRIWVYVNVHGKNIKPAQSSADVQLKISSIASQNVSAGFFAWTSGGLLPNYSINSWNLVIDNLIPIDNLNKTSWLVILIAVLGSVAASALIVSTAACYFISRYRALEKELNLADALRRLPGMPREYSVADIKTATKNFDVTMKLGQGGFGAVYMGILPAAEVGTDGRGQVQDVAVKKFTRKEDRCYEDFLAEVDVINRLRHKNIVPLVGWCYKKGELILIYEYMTNGSLDQHIFSKNLQQELPVLKWTTRYDIIMDCAAGLHYIHHEHGQTVLHRDIKASNILLDSRFNGRLGDFGLARIVAFNKNSFTDQGVAGTWGYIAPDYAVGHKATRQTDIYAFGVLILETFTGETALRTDETFSLLVDWVWWLHQEGRLIEAVDGRLAAGDFNADDANRMLLLGLACSNPNPLDRPTMTEVVQVIARSAPPPDVPLEKPAFVWQHPILHFDGITQISTDLSPSSNGLKATVCIQNG